MTAENENPQDQVDENVPADAVDETPQAEGTSDDQDRADAAAERATDAGIEAEEVADEVTTEPVVDAAVDAEDAADEAQTAAKPKAKARKAEKAADKAEQAADQAKSSARRGRGRRGGNASEPKAVPVGLQVSAQAKYVRTSARKARLVCDHIRGKDVVEARKILAFATRSAAEPWLKLLESAVANAEHNHELVGEDLRILSVHADEGPTLKRYRPRAMGRATRIRKRTSHLSITLTPKES
jgi:ribosomal protein L22